jgi:uncharacterized protein YecT (DUF1311 family)
MSRYLNTEEARQALGVASLQRAWRVLRDAGVERLGRDEKVGPGRPFNVYRAADVERVVRMRAARTPAERRRIASIVAGIARRKAKREAA